MQRSRGRHTEGSEMQAKLISLLSLWGWTRSLRENGRERGPRASLAAPGQPAQAGPLSPARWPCAHIPVPLTSHCLLVSAVHWTLHDLTVRPVGLSLFEVR